MPTTPSHQICTAEILERRRLSLSWGRINAALPQMLGVDHRKLSFRYQGPDREPAGVEYVHPLSELIA